MIRQAVKERKTLETAVSVSIGLDGSGKADIATGVGFFDHLLTLLCFFTLAAILLLAGSR